ncbi:hypothetical protein BH09PSE5_BH09PSE5_40810 [soil metagenome]
MTTPRTHDHNPLQHPEPASPLGPNPMGPEEPAVQPEEDGPPHAHRPTDSSDDQDETGKPPAPVVGG